MIKNCPVTIKDIKIVEAIFGPDIYSLKGKSTRPPRGRTGIQFHTTDYIKFPKEIQEMKNGIKLGMDIMYIQSVMFLITTSIVIGLITISVLPTRQKKDLYQALDTVFRVYNKASLEIGGIHADQEFKFTKDILTDLGIELIPVPAGKH